MGSILIRIDPEKVVNATADIRYLIPDTIEELTEGRVESDTFDYDDSDNMLIYLKSQNASADVLEVLEILKSHDFENDNFYEIAEIFLSEIDFAEFNDRNSGYIRYQKPNIQ